MRPKAIRPCSRPTQIPPARPRADSTSRFRRAIEALGVHDHAVDFALAVVRGNDPATDIRLITVTLRVFGEVGLERAPLVGSKHLVDGRRKLADFVLAKDLVDG